MLKDSGEQMSAITGDTVALRDGAVISDKVRSAWRGDHFCSPHKM